MFHNDSRRLGEWSLNMHMTQVNVVRHYDVRLDLHNTFGPNRLLLLPLKYRHLPITLVLTTVCIIYIHTLCRLDNAITSKVASALIQKCLLTLSSFYLAWIHSLITLRCLHVIKRVFPYVFKHSDKDSLMKS